MARYRSLRARPDVNGLGRWLARVKWQYGHTLNIRDNEGWPHGPWWPEHQQTTPRLTFAEMRRKDRRARVYTREEKWRALLARQ